MATKYQASHALSHQLLLSYGIQHHGSQMLTGKADRVLDCPSWMQDITVVGHDAKGKERTFYHPAFQSAAMFLGEMLCLIPFALLAWRKAALGRGKNRFLKQTRATRLHAALFFSFPAICDSGATTLLNVRARAQHLSV